MRRLLALLLLLSLPIFASEPTPSQVYNEACELALAGKRDAAFVKLTEAVELGFANWEHMQRDTDLVSLHDDPRWTPLVDKARATAKATEKKWNPPTIVTPYKPELSQEEKIAGLSRVWSEVRYNFANFDLIPDVDWDALYLAAIPRALAAKSTLEYYDVIVELVAKLRDGHTNAWHPGPLLDQRWGFPATRQKLIDGRILITRGELAGNEILEVDGRPWKEYAAAHVIPTLAASTPQDLDERTGDRLLQGAAGTTVSLKLRDKNGRVSTVQLERQPRAKRLPSLDAVFEFRMLPGNVAYVALNDFSTQQAADEYDKHYDEIAKADAIIFDLRNNGGGSSNVGYRVLATLIDKPYPATRAQKIVYRPTDRARQQPPRFEFEEGKVGPDAKGRHYTKPVAVLIGPATYSAAEDFLVAWRSTGRGKTYGTATGGSTGQPLTVPLPGGGGMRICTKRDRFPDGSEFVRVGVKPDVEVKPAFDAVQRGADPVLERALQDLRR